MKTLKRLAGFRHWLDSVNDARDKAIIAQHVERLAKGLGDVKPVGNGIFELRIHVGQGWRVYFIEIGGTIILLLAGGAKKTQARDIRRAKNVLDELKSKRTPRKQ